MFETYTDVARKTLALANREAQRFRHEYIGVEHILLGLVKEGTGIGPTTLETLGVDLGIVRNEVEKLIKVGPEPFMLSKLPMTPRAKKTHAIAVDLARTLHHSQVNTGHLLLALLSDDNGVAAEALRIVDVKPNAVREEVVRLTTLVGPSEDMRKLNSLGKMAASEEPSFNVWIDPGSADAADIAQVFAAMSDVHRAGGGTGLTFTKRGLRAYAVEEVPQ